MYSYDTSPCMACPHNMMCAKAQPPMPQMPAAQMPSVQMPVVQMPVAQEPLETMYPEIYMIVMPALQHHCDEMEDKYGMMYYPSYEELKEMAKEIHKKTDWEHHYKGHHCKDHHDEDGDKDSEYDEDRKGKRIGYERYPVGMDLIHIMLIHELMKRRRRHHHHHYY